MPPWGELGGDRDPATCCGLVHDDSRAAAGCTVTTLAARSVGFRSLTEAIDTTTPGGRMVFHLYGALGQLERDLI